MDITFPCGKDVVEAVLPHRDPFCWVSRVVACEPGVDVTAELDVDPDLPLFKGHFPGHPVLPGVIIMEALAQAASFCILVERGAEGSIGFLTGIDGAKFRRQVEPGETVRAQGAHREVLVALVRGRGGGERRRRGVRVGDAEVRAGESGSVKRREVVR